MVAVPPSGRKRPNDLHRSVAVSLRSLDLTLELQVQPCLLSLRKRPVLDAFSICHPEFVVQIRQLWSALPGDWHILSKRDTPAER
jgi:hypothetical protein